MIRGLTHHEFDVVAAELSGAARAGLETQRDNLLAQTLRMSGLVGRAELILESDPERAAQIVGYVFQHLATWDLPFRRGRDPAQMHRRLTAKHEKMIHRGRAIQLTDLMRRATGRRGR